MKVFKIFPLQNTIFVSEYYGDESGREYVLNATIDSYNSFIIKREDGIEGRIYINAADKKLVLIIRNNKMYIKGWHVDSEYEPLNNLVSFISSTKIRMNDIEELNKLFKAMGSITIAYSYDTNKITIK